jgi:hypothetical protein
MRPRGRRRPVVVAVAAIALLASGAAGAQRYQRYFREGTFPPRWVPAQMPDGAFVICRLAYRQVRAEQSGIGWQTDYPYAEINLTTRLSELTRTVVSRDANQDPNHYSVRLTDDTLFNCPILVASDAGTIGLDEVEAARLRAYLLKGGFFWADDFWGTEAWDHFASQMTRVLPPPDYHIEDVALGDPMLRTMFEMKHIPQITNIQFWRRSGGVETSERGYDSAEVHLRAIRGRHGRILVLATHNTDIADSWEREGEDPAFFYQFSPDGYALGINVLVHVMTH